MRVMSKRESKLLGRTEVDVLFDGKAGMLSRKDATREVAQQMRVDEKLVGIVKLGSGSGSRDLTGKFYVYESAEGMTSGHPKYLGVRLLGKEEREAYKQALKKAAQPQAK